MRGAVQACVLRLGKEVAGAISTYLKVATLVVTGSRLEVVGGRMEMRREELDTCNANASESDGRASIDSLPYLAYLPRLYCKLCIVPLF